MRRDYQRELVSRVKSLDKELRSHDLGRVINIGRIQRDDLPSKHHDIFSIETAAKAAKHGNILMSARIHGDEPASMDALLEFFEQGMFREYSELFAFYALPNLNPSGSEIGTHENYQKINLNRDFSDNNAAREVDIIKNYLSDPFKRYLGAINLHEDNVDEAEGGFKPSDSPRSFYLYETSIKEQSIGPKIIGFLDSRGIEICGNDKVYHDPCEGGVIWTAPDAPLDEHMPCTMEEYLRVKKHSEHVLTFETPTCWDLKKRVDVHHLASCYALDHFYDKAKEHLSRK
jgi:hypothetical protein